MKKFAVEMEEGKNGAWNWEIKDPRGTVIAWGARVGKKADVLAHLKKALDRYNSNGSSTTWRGYQSKKDVEAA